MMMMMMMMMMMTVLDTSTKHENAEMQELN